MTRRLFTVFSSMILLFAAAFAQAQVPRTINDQGYLTTPSGAPVSNPGLQVVFRIYDLPSSGSALHTETQTVVVTNGIFNVLLGSAAALTLPFDVQYYLGVTPGADAEMTPRQPLASSPYAIRALTATSALTANSATTAMTANSANTANTANSATTATTATTATSATTAATATTATTAASADALSPSATVPGSQISNGSITAAKLASNGCNPNQILQYNGTAWICATPPAASSGTVTSIEAGTGLTGGTITSSGTIAADTAYLQRRITTGCEAGSSIRSIGIDGSVTCQAAPNASANPPQANTSDTLDATGDVGKFVSMTTGTDGLPIMSYHDTTNNRIKTLKCGNLACSSGNVITTHNLNGPSSSIAIGADGLPIFSVIESSLRTAKCADAACTSVTLRTVDSSGISSAQTSSIAIGADGLAVISYSTSSSLRVAKCGNADCSSGNIISTIDNTGVTGRSNSIAVAFDGLPVISYYSNSSGVMVAKCGNASCSAGNTVALSANSTVQEPYTSVVIGADGLPVVAYFSSTPGGGGSSTADLRVFKCTLAICNTGTATNSAIDTVGDVGRYPSITIGLDGNPLISYYDATNGDLKVARCGDAACSSNNLIAALATTGDVGQYTAISVRGDGIPMIAYYDVTNADLKIARCANTYCVPYFRRR